MANSIQNDTSGVEARAAQPYQVDRIFVGDRTAEEVVADLIKVHAQSA